MQRLLMLIASTVVASTVAGCGVSAIAGSVVALSSDETSSRTTAAAPVVAAVTPADGSHAGGTVITITGQAFPADATVSFAGVAATNVVVLDDRTLTATTPPSTTAAEVDVTVASATAGSGTMRHGFVYTNELPSVVIAPFGVPQSQHIVVSFMLRDPEGDTLDISLEVDAGDGYTAVPADEIVSGGTTHLASSPSGTPHAITFDSRTLFPAQDATGVRLRITPVDRADGRVGLPGVSTAFEVINNSPVRVEVLQPGRDAFRVVLGYRVFDADSGEEVRVTALRWQDLRSGASGPVTIASGQGLGPVSATSAGVLGTTVWDSFADLGFGNDRLVTVTVTVDDGFTSSSATTRPFFVSNGPLGEATSVGLPGTVDAAALGDVNGDGRPDLAASGYVGVSFGLNVGRSFAVGNGAKAPPPLPTTSPPFTEEPTSVPFMTPQAAPGPLALLDVDADQRLDLLAGAGPFHPGGLTPLAQNLSFALAMANGDAESGYVHVMAHQATLVARGTATLGLPDVAGGVWESAQAPIAARAPHAFSSGSTLFPVTSTGDPSFDRVGWFIQALTAAELDAPSVPTLPNDLVIVHGLFQLGRASAGDLRGVVVLRQTEPVSGLLGPPVYLDPTDMGQLPVSAVVVDVLGPSRAESPWTELASAPVGTTDIVVACRGDSSLTFYFQVEAARWPAPGAPRFASLNLPMSAVNPGTPPGDVSGVAVGDLNGDSLTDVVVTGANSRTITILLHDADPTAPGSLLPLTAGRLPFRRAAVLSLESLGVGAPAVADINGDGLNDILVSMTLSTELRLFIGAGLVDGVPQFSAVRASTPNTVYEVLTPDVDRDGRPDVLARAILGVSLLLQTSPGTLDERFVPVATGTSPQMLRVGDVLGLGSPQVVCPSSGDGTVQVFGRDGETTLRLAAQYTIAAPPGVVAQLSTPLDTLLADVTGDGAPDITTLVRFVVDAAGLASGFGVIASPLSGGRVTAVRVTSFASSVGTGIAGGDLDGDGVSEIVVASVGGVAGGGLTVFAGGAAFPEVTSRPSPYALGCEVLDLDGDGYVDVLVGRSDDLGVFYGAATGLSAEASSIPANAFHVVTADLDGDGRLDIVVADPTRTDVQVCYQTTPRSFTVVRLVGGHQCEQPAVGDLDGDGRLDIAVPWGQESVVAVYHQRADAAGPADRFAAPIVYSTGSGPMGCAIVDVDGDLRNDVVVSSRGTSALNVFVQR